MPCPYSLGVKMKTYKNGVGLADDIKKLVASTNEAALPKVMDQLVSDCNTQHLAPILTGALQTQITYGVDKKSMVNTGQVTWEVVYARRRYYEGSKSGVPMWAEVAMRNNKKSYVAMIKEVFEEEKRKL